MSPSVILLHIPRGDKFDYLHLQNNFEHVGHNLTHTLSLSLSLTQHALSISLSYTHTHTLSRTLQTPHFFRQIILTIFEQIIYEYEMDVFIFWQLCIQLKLSITNTGLGFNSHLLMYTPSTC